MITLTDDQYLITCAVLFLLGCAFGATWRWTYRRPDQDAELARRQRFWPRLPDADVIDLLSARRGRGVPELLVMYCSTCGQRNTTHNGAAFPSACPSCSGTAWQSFPPIAKDPMKKKRPPTAS